MAFTDDHLLMLSEYLKKTLSPDVQVRRPGKIINKSYIFIKTNIN